MDWPILILGIVSIAFVADLIGTPIICGYYRGDPHRGFPLFVTMVVDIAFCLTIIWLALVVVDADVLLLIFGGAMFMSSIVSTDSKRSQEGHSSSVKACGCLLFLIYAIAIIVLTFAIGWGVSAAIGLVFGALLIMAAGQDLAKKFDTLSRLEGIGSGIRENKARQMANNRRMNEFRASLKQWEAEGYSGLKDIIAIKNFDQMEGKFSEAEQKVNRLKAVESHLNELFRNFPGEREVFEFEMESARKKQKDLSKVDEVEREIKNLSNTLTEHCRLKNEILDRIAEVVKSEI